MNCKVGLRNNILKKIIKSFTIVVVLFFTTIFSSCALWNHVNLDSSTFNDFSNRVFATLLSGDDMSQNYLFNDATKYGLKSSEASLPTPSVSSASGKIFLNLYFGQINGYNYEELNEDQKCTYLIIKDLLDNINATTTDMSYLSSDYLGSYLGYQAQLPLLLSEYNLRNKSDVEKIIKYVNLIPETFNAYYEFEIKKAEAGYGMPDFVIEKVIGQCESMASKLSTKDNFMVTTLSKKINACTFLTDTEKSNYNNLIETAITSSMYQGYFKLTQQLVNLKGKAKNNLGLAYYVKEDGTEIGKQYYTLAFKKATGYDVSIEEAEKYIDSKLTFTISSVNYYRNLYKTDSTFAGYVDKISNGQLYFMHQGTTPLEQLDSYKEKLTGHFPSLTTNPNITIQYVDESMQDYFSPAAYMTSPIDETSNEVIYLNPASIYKTNSVGVNELDYNYLYTTLAHEGITGHMYQNIYFKNQDVNILRKVMKSSGYSEGWATYCEKYSYNYLRGELPDNVVDYLITLDDFNSLVYSRLDMGIHYDGWTQTDTYNYLAQYNSNTTMDNVKKVFEQLVEVPTNSQMYYYTYFHLKDLRNDVIAHLGDSFDEVAFHKAILDCGALPLRYVEEIVRNKFIAK